MEKETKEYVPPAPLPYGEYPAVIKEAEVQPFKSGNGRRLALKIEVQPEDAEKRIVFRDITLKNKNSKKAEEYGQKGADILLKALGVDDGLEGVDHDMLALQEYTDIPFVAVLGIDQPREYVNSEGETKTSPARNIVLTFKRA